MGSAAVYDPQKGAKTAEIKPLEEGLENLAQILAAETGRDRRMLEGAGGAGGAAGGLWSALGARLRPGISTASTSGVSGSIRMMTSAPFAASAEDPTAVAPFSTSSCERSLTRRNSSGHEE